MHNIIRAAINPTFKSGIPATSPAEPKLVNREGLYLYVPPPIVGKDCLFIRYA